MVTWRGSRPIIQGIVGSWVGRVTVSATVRASMSNKFQHVTGDGNDTNLSKSKQVSTGAQGKPMVVQSLQEA